MYISPIIEPKHIDMEDFDNLAIHKVAMAELERIKEPHRRKILENFIEHAKAETTGDYEALVASCSEKGQQYAVYGSSEFQKSIQPQDVESMKEFYHMLIASNVYLIHGEAEKLIVGDDAIHVEFIIHQLYPGEIIPAAFGFDFGEEGEVYQLTQRVATTFIFDEDGKGCGEHSWTDGETRPEQLRKEDPHKVPEQFWNNPIEGPRQKPF